jgi:hypothetical protein
MEDGMQGQLEPDILLQDRYRIVKLLGGGGIVSGGVNRGIDKGWDDSPLKLRSIAVQEHRLVYVLAPSR